MIKLMKRTTVKRCISKTLAMFIAVALMISALSVPVFAAQTKSETYLGNDGNYYTVTVTNSGTASTVTPTVTGTRVDHIMGTASVISAGTYSMTYTTSFDFPPDYATWLTEVAKKVSMQETYKNTSERFTNSITIPASASTGMYRATTTITGYSGTWYVDKSGASSSTQVAYGTIKFAPVSCTGYFVGYQKVSSGILP